MSQEDVGSQYATGLAVSGWVAMLVEDPPVDRGRVSNLQHA